MSSFRMLLPAAVLVAAAACSGADMPARTQPSVPSTPRSTATVSPDEATFVLVVSNQSFREPSIGIRVEIDGALIVDGPFPVEGQHNFVSYPLELAPGRHSLVARSSTGVDSTQTFELPQSSSPASARRYATLFYWNYEDEPERFDWRFLTEPPAFG